VSWKELLFEEERLAIRLLLTTIAPYIIELIKEIEADRADSLWPGVGSEGLKLREGPGPVFGGTRGGDVGACCAREGCGRELREGGSCS